MMNLRNCLTLLWVQALERAEMRLVCPPSSTRWQQSSSNWCSHRMWEEKEERGWLQYGRGQQAGASGSFIKDLRAARREGSRLERGWWEKM